MLFIFFVLIPLIYFNFIYYNFKMDHKEFLSKKIESDKNIKTQNEPIKKTKYEEMKEYAA